MSLRDEDEAEAENTDAVDRDSVPADALALEIPQRHRWNSWTSNRASTRSRDWPGWDHNRLRRRTVARWKNSTAILIHKRADKVLRLFDWKFRHKFEHVSDNDWDSTNYFEKRSCWCAWVELGWTTRRAEVSEQQSATLRREKAKTLRP